MQDPVREIRSVVKGLIESPTAAEQQRWVQKNFAPDASFNHPLCAVASGPNSRDRGVLPIYQWLRIMFTPTIETHNVAFDQDANKLFLDATQTLRPNVWPVSYYAPACRLIVVLFLQRGSDGRFYIRRQEDYYEPEVMPGMLLPGLSGIISLIKLLGGIGCFFLAFFVQITIGYWNPSRSRAKLVNGVKS